MRVLGQRTRNWKTWRFLQNADSTGECGDEVFHCGAPSGSAGINGTFHWRVEGGLPMYPDRVWFHRELEARFGVGSDGVFRLCHNSSALMRDRNALITGFNSSVTAPQRLSVGHYWAYDADADCGANPGATVYLDRLYYDTSLRRVVIGNNADYNLCGRRAAQPYVSSWANTQIDFSNMDFGGLSQSDSHWIFVIGPNGVGPTGSANTPGPVTQPVYSAPISITF